MKFLSTILCLAAPVLLADTVGVDQATPQHNPKLAEAEAKYAYARTILEDKSYTDVSGVPSLLQEASADGFAHADLLLLDVWEGKLRGLDKNLNQAHQLAMKLAQQEAPLSSEQAMVQREAQYRLALYKEKGIGCKPLPSEAFFWMQTASQQGHHAARAELARYYMMGIGCQKNYISSLKLLKETTKQAPETPNLYFYLGFMCERGLGLSRPQLTWAIQYYRRGAELNDDRAANNLASMYERGIGVPVDNSLALRLYRQSAKWGNKDASVNLGRLSSLMEQRGNQKAGTPWQLRVNRGYLRILNELPVELPFTKAYKEWNMHLEKEYAEIK